MVFLRAAWWQAHHWDSALTYVLSLPDEPSTSRARALAEVTTHLGDSWLWFPLAGLIWFYARRTRRLQPALVQGWILSMALAAASVLLVKAAVRRARPSPATEQFHGPGADRWSFPSGHAARLAATALWLPLIWPRWGRLGAVVSWGLALLIGWSRVRLHVHHVGDVLAGFVLGTLVAWRVRSTTKVT